jgi:dihydropteroate synthase
MTLNCNGKILDLKIPKVMGILNLAPDSFYDGGKYKSVKLATQRCCEMLAQGADIIDIGAASSRPGAQIISEKEELNRLIPILKVLVKEFDSAVFSVDTFRSGIAKASLDEGVALINDITAGEFDTNMLPLVGKYNAVYVAMHMQGLPNNMQENPSYKNITSEILTFFLDKIKSCHLNKISDVIIDPGFGFGKKINQNFTILKNLETFQELNVPLLVGFSRKSMIYKSLNIEPADALNGTSVLNTVAILKKANILRVHDVKEAKESIELCKKLF